MKTKRIISTLMISSTALLFATPAYAETSTTTPHFDSSKRQEKACERVTERVNNRKEKLDEIAQKTQSRFEEQDAKLQKLQETAASYSIDTTQLVSDLKTWQNYTQTIRDLRVQIAEKIQSAVDLVCSGDLEGGRAAFEESKTLVQQMRDTRKERRDFWVNTIRPDLKEIRDQIKEQVGSNNG